MKDKIRLIIPGTWKSTSNFLTRMKTGQDQWLISEDGLIQDHETGMSFEFALLPPVDGLDDDFRFGSPIDPIGEDTLSAIGQHDSYLSIGSRQSGINVARSLSELALGAMASGGVAVRVEGSKCSYSPKQWRESVEVSREMDFLLYKLFVWAFVFDRNACNTIGMSFLGHPDVSIKTNDLEIATSVYHEFAKYLLIQDPEIKSGETILFENTPDLWRITKSDHIFADDPEIDFSLGMWTLQQA